MSASLNSRQAQILIIDDSLNNLHVLCATLKQAGYKTRGVKNSKMALISIQAALPDLILLDIKMPGIDGYEVCRRLKANPDICNIPVIFISALDQPIDLVKAFEVGGCDYITKPFQIEEVLVRVKHQLTIRDLEKQLTDRNHQLQHEIEQQQIAQKALQESNKKFTKVFLLSPNAMAITEYPKCTFLEVNQAFLEMTGYANSEVLGKDPYSLNLFVNLSQAQAISDLLKTHKKVQNRDIIIQTKTAEERVILLSAELIYLQDKLYSLCVFNDITERQKIERERNAILNELQERVQLEKVTRQVVERMRRTLDLEQIFRSITEDIRQTLRCDRVGIFRFKEDWSGEFVAESVGKGWLSILNCDETIKQPLESDRCYINLYTQEQQTLLDTYLQETQGGRYHNSTPYMCVSNIEQSGFDPCYVDLLRQFQAKAYLTVPLFTDRQLWGLLACYQNDGPRLWKDTEINFLVEIGEQLGVALNQAQLLEKARQQSEELNRTIHLAEAANQTKSDFLAKMTHELRTPLNAILGFTQILQQDVTLANSTQEHLSIIHNSGEHLLGLINDVLEMAKLESGSTRLNNNPFDLHKFLNDLGMTIRLQAIAKGLCFQINIDSQVPQWIEADEIKLRQVLLNLLDNSLKFTESGTIYLRVSYPSSLRFEVEDTGSGISTETLSTLFSPFSNAPSQEGTGLGLALSQRFINLMGGQIQVQTEVGEGSCFTFELPIESINSQIQSTSEHQHPSYRILAIGEHGAEHNYIVHLLQLMGFEVREATGEEEVMALWESWFPHLMLIDISISTMDSWAIAQQIRATPQGRHAVIIATIPESFDAFINLMEWDDWIDYPINEAIFIEKIARCLQIPYSSDRKSDGSHYSKATNGYLSPSSSTSLSALDPYWRLRRTTDLEQLKDHLNQMPLDWTKQLYQAACRGSDLTILQLIASIPEQFQNLSDRLAGWANDFQFEQIISLIEPIEISQD
ncbi:response regulator [Roseofilum casamattae]|uniref:histidine kinase n=1 Tax=Roseofilum casamattae BLCC-M143 TaxID=3022442 RepID=A0ABT7C159_9CYAN|nr:response regulator [Roseofilum casamattae]MDJ1185186.1 response regulator [Roseofilum casamattae BLCC-M143]